MKSCFRKISELSLLLLFIVLISAGCSEDEVTPPEETAEFQILSILTNPLAPRPGTVDTLSARVTGNSSGGRLSYRWRVDGGTLMEDDEGVVRWQVPQQKGDYTITVRMSLAGEVDSLSRTVAVKDQEIIDTGRLHSIYPNVIDGNLYFISPYYSRFISEDERYSFADFVYYGADLY
ncbi:MAG: hypothetical protein GF417_04520, partial [Candidatus Latescibacteria bacterium]|nr:hypothetical protein [bacterium]MBD3423687.1 hypothetical protein [Candidatus Latescibacterota bacterium]